MKVLVTGTAGFIGPHIAMCFFERDDEMLSLQAGDVPDTEADVSELIAAVDYRPAVSVDDGVSHFVNWYGSYYA